jgi:6-phosphogluconolactonase
MSDASQLLFIGTFTGGVSEGIYRARLDPDTGALTEPELAARLDNPAFFALHPELPVLYAVVEVGQRHGAAGGALAAFRIEEDGGLSFLGEQFSHGAAPCHVSVDPTGRLAFVANYAGGSVTAFPLREDGSPKEASAVIRHEGSGPNPQRQEAPHPHAVTPTTDGARLLVPDLGTDELRCHGIDAATGAMGADAQAPVRMAPGMGPRHVALADDGRTAYCIHELGSAITVLRAAETGGPLEPTQTIGTLPEDFEGTSHTAEIAVHPDGGFVYGSNRGHDSVAAYCVHEEGRLGWLGATSTGGATPRHFAIAPGGDWLLTENLESDAIAVFRIDRDTGALETTGHGCAVPAPACVAFP